MNSIVPTSISKEAKIPFFETSFQNIFPWYDPENFIKRSNIQCTTREDICDILFYGDKKSIDALYRKISINNQYLLTLPDSDRANIITICARVIFGTQKHKRQEADILNIINILRAKKKPSLSNHTPSQVEKIVAMIPPTTTPSQLKFSVS